MPRPNLSFENLAFALAALSVASCSRPSAEPATSVKADQTPTASAAPPPPPPVATAAAEEQRKEGEALPSAAASAAEVPRQPSKRVKGAPGGGAGHGGSTGSASCGAGTCTADMKKK